MRQIEQFVEETTFWKIRSQFTRVNRGGGVLTLQSTASAKRNRRESALVYAAVVHINLCMRSYGYKGSQREREVGSREKSAGIHDFEINSNGIAIPPAQCRRVSAAFCAARRCLRISRMLHADTSTTARFLAVCNCSAPRRRRRRRRQRHVDRENFFSLSLSLARREPQLENNGADWAKLQSLILSLMRKQGTFAEKVTWVPPPTPLPWRCPYPSWHLLLFFVEQCSRLRSILNTLFWIFHQSF